MPSMRVLRFSVFELDEASGELTRAGRRVALARQSFIVVWRLASRAGQVVTREELIRALWTDGTHVDFNRGLNFAVAAARRALGDDARRPRFVETVTGRGYRFIAEVHEVAVVDPPTQDVRVIQSPPVAAATSWTTSIGRWALAAVVPLVIAQGPDLVRVHTRLTAQPAALEAFARGDYESAVALDDRFAEAQYALASQYRDLGESRTMPQRVALEHARTAVSRALALEEAPESRRLLGSLRLVVDWDFDGARREIERALRTAPDWDLGLAAYADILSASGDAGGALDAIGRALALSPGCDFLFMQSAVLHYRARQYTTALDRLRRAEALTPEWRRADPRWAINAHGLAFQIAVQLERWADAQREAIVLVGLHGGSAARADEFAALPARRSVQAFLEASAGIVRAAAARGGVPAWRQALASIQAGHTDEALSWLEQSGRDRESEFLFVLRDPLFDALGASARYQALVGLTRTGRRSVAL